MNSEVMDPGLDLQQLASRALEYNGTPDSFPQYSQSPIQFTSNVKQEVTEPKFFCPFPSCNRHYKRKDLLKRHLTTLLASQDENHGDETVWNNVKETGIMTIYTRPRNLTEEQKKLRRKESNLRHRIKYAQELKEKRNRKRRVEKLLEGKQVGVQTPDWDAEARAQASLNAAAQMDGTEEFVADVIDVSEAQPSGRRGAKRQ